MSRCCEFRNRDTSVVVSKFATFRYRSPSELRNQNDTRNQYVASVLSIPKFAKRRCRDVANFGIGTLVGVTLKPWRPGLPDRQPGVVIANRHLDLRQTLFVEDFVLGDHLVQKEQVGRQRID